MTGTETTNAARSMGADANYTCSFFDESLLETEVRDNVFALTVDGHSMSPQYPNGTIMLVDGSEKPVDGDLVIAKLANGLIICSTYCCKENAVHLIPINKSEEHYEYSADDFVHSVLWVYPIVEAIVNLRRRRWQENMVSY